MSETEDIRAIADNNDFHSVIEGESGRSSSVDYLDTYEDIPKETVKEFGEEGNIKGNKEETLIENEKKSVDPEKKEVNRPAAVEPGTAIHGNVVGGREEATTGTGRTGSRDGRNENAPVGEWNSLPVLVERLRAALELSLGSRRDDEHAALPEDSGIDSEEDFRIRGSMEQALGNCKEPELKKDLKFLEDLLLSDIETALSRLRETLERIDVAALARHGAASDPTSKLQLLRLVSSLLSRLQVPDIITDKATVLPSTSLSRRRRGTRHTIGVSAEELARARKWFEEERNAYQREDVLPFVKEQKEVPRNSSTDRKSEEIRDKFIKDAINQRQLLEDKNKEIRESCAYRGVQQVDTANNKVVIGEQNAYQPPYRANGNYPVATKDEENIEEDEERSRVSKLAAVLRQRAELATSAGGKYANKFTAKKTKIKRANTIDIPSYLKLQESLGHENTGCVSLRRPINVGDKVSFGSVNAIVPTFQPKTDNDRKFLALINKNNDAPSNVPVVPFKICGKIMDMSSLTNENWNSRFSNIKTSFDKSNVPEDKENKASLKTRANKMFPGAQTQVYPDWGSTYVHPATKTSSPSGFRHAPSSPFKKIEKSPAVSPSKVPPAYHWPKNAPVPTNTLKEKARMMFDREPSKPSRVEGDSPEKHGFPRPPWLDQENRANGTVTENGKLDYRSFCKQFAPFVGRPPSTEPKKLERDKVPGVVDGKISFKMIPDKRVQAHPPVQYPTKRRDSKEKFEPVRGATIKGHEVERSSFADATLRGSSSVAVQTGVNDEHQNEGRSFQVAPKISKGSDLGYSNASVQTSDSSKTSDKQWKPGYFEHVDTDETSEGQRFVLDHNQNYRAITGDSEGNGPSNSRKTMTEQVLRDSVPLEDTRGYRKPDEADTREYSSPYAPHGLCDHDLPDTLEVTEQKASDWPNDASAFPDDQNIQNQDISPDVGVVTRYTCAIATVASSVDSPEPRSEEVAADSRTSSSPSPSQWSWSRSRPPTNENTTPEDEIRRHNLLQQSLVRRLQNEVTSLNEPTLQTSNYGQHLTVDQPKTFNYPADQTSNLVESQHQTTNLTQDQHQPLNLNQNQHQPASLVQSQHQLANLTQSHQYQSANLTQSPQHQTTNLAQSHQHQSTHLAQSPQHQTTNLTQSLQHQTTNLTQSPHHQTTNLTQIHQHQSTHLAQSHQHQSANLPQIHQHHSTHLAQSHQHQSANLVQSHQRNFDQPANFDVPQGASRYGKFLAPVPQKKSDPSPTHSSGPMTVNRVIALREAYEQPANTQAKPLHKERSPVPNGSTHIDSSDEYLVSCATKPSRSIVLSKSESWHQLAISNSHSRAPRPANQTPTFSRGAHPKPPKPRSPSSQKLRSKQFEASSMADSVKKMEDKIRQYFDHPGEHVESRDSPKSRRSPRSAGKSLVGLSRSRTMPGLADDKLRLLMPATQQTPLLNVNTADVDKVFDDLFEEATRTDDQC